MPADLKSLRLFVSVADHGSISEAARHCHLALAAASRRIADLEARTRLPLLVRHARGVTLTTAGHGLLLHARTVVAAMGRLDAELDDYRQGIAGVVSVTANASSIAQFLPAQIGSFLRLHPDLRVDLQERASVDVVKTVVAGRADIGIFEGRTTAEGLDCQPYREDELAVVVARGHPLARRRRVGIDELLGCEHIVVREGTAVYRVMVEAAELAGVPLKVRMQVGSFDMVCRMVAQGIGVGVMPRAVVATPWLDASPGGEGGLALKSLVLDAPWARRHHLLGVRRHQDLTAAARALLSHLARPGEEAAVKEGPAKAGRPKAGGPKAGRSKAEAGRAGSPAPR